MLRCTRIDSLVDYILQIDLFFVYRTVLSDVIVVLFEKQRAALETKSQWILNKR